MQINVDKNEGTVTISPIGRLDSMSADELGPVIDRELEACRDIMYINLKEVDFISSKGLRILVAAYRKLNGRKMIIANANAPVLEVIRLSGLMKVFTLQ